MGSPSREFSSSMKKSRSKYFGSLALWAIGAIILLLPTIVLGQKQPAPRQEGASPINVQQQAERRRLQAQQCGFGNGGTCIGTAIAFEVALADSNVADIPLCDGFFYQPTSTTILTGQNKRLRCMSSASEDSSCTIDGANFDTSEGLSAFVSLGNSALDFCGLTFQNFQLPSNGGGGARVFELAGATVRAEFRFSTFENNGFNLGADPADGGTMSILRSANVQIRDSDFSANRASRHGGVISVAGPSIVNITQTRFSENRASDTGAVIFALADTDVSIATSTLSINRAGIGGGVASINQNANIIIRDSTVSANAGGLVGGVLQLATFSFGAIIDSTVDRNIADYGGVVHAETSLSVLDGAVMTANSAAMSGGVVFVYETGNVEVVDSQLNENSAGRSGGAIYMTDDASVDLDNADFDGNTAPIGEHILVDGSAILNGCLNPRNEFSNPIRLAGVVDSDANNACFAG